MEIEIISYLIHEGNRNIRKPDELEKLWGIVSCQIKNFQQCYKSASVAAYLVEKFKFYERDGKKSCQEYLASLGYSKGAISHMRRYGEFIVMMEFSETQIPPEYVVRAILTAYNKENWREIYKTACHDHKLNEEYQRIANVPLSDDDVDDDVNDDVDDVDVDDDVDDDVEKKTQPVDSVKQTNQSVSEKGKAEHNSEDKDTTQESDDYYDNDTLNYIPTKKEVDDALVHFRMDDEDNTYLPSIGKIIPRGETFTHGVLEKYKGEIDTVPLLSHVISDYLEFAKSALPEADIAAIKAFCKEIHTREAKQIQEVIDSPML